MVKDLTVRSIMITRIISLFIFFAGPALSCAEALNSPAERNLALLPQLHDIEPRDSVDFSPDGKILSTTQKVRSLIQLWNVNGYFLREWVHGGGNGVSGAKFGNSKIFLASFGYNDVKIWNPADGSLLNNIAVPSTYAAGRIEGIAFSPDDALMAVFGFNWSNTGYAFINIWDIKNNVLILDKAEATPRQHIRGLHFADGGKAIAAYAGDTVTISDLRGRKINEWNVEGITDLSVGKAGKEILCSSKDTVSVWTLEGKLLSRFAASRQASSLFYPVINVASLPGSDTIVTFSRIGFHAWDRQGHLLWEHFQPEAGQGVFWMYGLLGMAMSPDGKNIALRTNLGPLDLWNVSARAMNGNFSKQANRINTFAFFPGDDIITSSLRNIDRTGIVKGNLIREADNVSVRDPHSVPASDSHQSYLQKEDGEVTGVNSSVSYILASPDGSMIAVAYLDGYVRLFDRKWQLLKKFPDNAWYTRKYLAPLAFSPDSKSLAVCKHRDIVIHDIASGEILSEIPLGRQATVGELRFMPDGKTLLVGEMTDGYKLIDIESKETQAVLKWGWTSRQFNPAFVTDGGTIGIAGHKGIHLWDAKGAELPPLTTPGSGCANILAYNGKNDLLASSGGCGSVGVRKYSLGDSWKIISKHSVGATSLKFSADGLYLFASFKDGMLKIWNTRNWQEVSLMSSTEDEWLIYTPDGYFDASPHGGELLAMVEGLEAYGIEQFAARNNRPDLILERMGFGTPEQLSHYQVLYQKRLKKLGLTEAMLSGEAHVPEAKIVKTARNGKFLDLGFELSDSKYPLKSFNIFVNNVSLFGQAGREITGGSFSGTEKVELGDGRNKIEISAMNTAGAESYRAFTYAEYKNTKLRNLYYLAFGVSKYKDHALDLNYADKDVKDLEAAVLNMGASYEKIFTRTFLNSEVTAENIKKAKDLLKGSKVDDTVILSLAGHGGYDKGTDPKYYYLPHDADPDDLTKTGVVFEDIEEVLTDIKPRKKLFLLDTCESGELEDEVYAQYLALAKERGFKARTFRKPGKARGTGANKWRSFLLEKDRFIYNNLARRSGAVIFSSSLGSEISYESSLIKNGFFSREIINALTDKDADKDSNGKISINELKAYVRAAVSKDTGGLQNPTIDRDNLSQNIELPLVSN